MKNVTLAAMVGAACMIVQPAAAASVTIKSMYYSTDRMVPHIIYDGPTERGDIDQISSLIEANVHCRTECAPEDGAPIAVVSLNGPGGDYHEGLELAEFFRANSIATVVESGSYCYSACAFAFLGGSAFSSQEGVGTYIDRVAEPGSIIGFHAPYLTESTLLSFLEDQGAEVVMDNNRANYARMVEELVGWNLDPNIIGWMVFQGPDETYDIKTPNDLFLTRSALPDSPPSVWISDKPSAVYNACLRLMSEFYQTDPAFEAQYLENAFITNTGVNSFDEPLSGFHISDTPLRVGHCSITDASMQTDGAFDIALYLTAGITGKSQPVLSFFNRPDGWSTMGIGADPTRRIFKKGSMNHFFLPGTTALEDLDEQAMLALRTRRFETVSPVTLPTLPSSFATEYQDATTLIARNEFIRVFVQVGNDELFNSAVEQDFAQGITLTNDSVSGIAFVKSGSYASSGHPFSSIGFKSENTSVVTRIESLHPDSSPWTEQEASLVRQVECGIAFGGIQLEC